MSDRDSSPQAPAETSAPTGSHDPTARRRRASLKWSILVVVLVALVVVNVVALALNHSSSSTATISVTGSGTVQGTPDTVSFQVGVQNVAPSAVGALEANNARVRAMEATLQAHGVAKKDMQTSGLDIYQNTNNQGVVTGFTVANYLDVTMHQIKKAGGAIDAAAHAVGNGIQLNGITFSISNESKLLASARAKAVIRENQAAGVLNSRQGHAQRPHRSRPGRQRRRHGHRLDREDHRPGELDPHERLLPPGCRL